MRGSGSTLKPPRPRSTAHAPIRSPTFFPGTREVRDVRVYVDRPNFTLNPTNCAREVFRAQLWGGGLDPFSSADDAPVSLRTLSSRKLLPPRLQAKPCTEADRGDQARNPPRLAGDAESPHQRREHRQSGRHPASLSLPRSSSYTHCLHQGAVQSQSLPGGPVYGHATATPRCWTSH